MSYPGHSGHARSDSTLAHALFRLRTDDSNDARRIREAAAVVRRGTRDQIRKLCVRKAGWDVGLLHGRKCRPLYVLKTELRRQIIAAARRHLCSVQAAPSTSSSAPAPMAAAADSAVQPEARSAPQPASASSSLASAGISNAKRLLAMKPTTARTKRLRKWVGELASQPGQSQPELTNAFDQVYVRTNLCSTPWQFANMSMLTGRPGGCCRMSRSCFPSRFIVDGHRV